jgi:hypothetical protein
MSKILQKKQNYSIAKHFFTGATALAVLVGAGMAASPSQASTLAWDDGTTDFFADVNPVDGDKFTLTFSPESLGGVSAVFQASGLFSPPFPVIPPPKFVQLIPPPTATLTYVAGSLSGDLFEYTLDDDLVFQFDADGDGSYVAANDVSVTYGAGSTFLGDFDRNSTTNAIEGVGFVLETELGDAVNIAGASYTPTGIELGFEDIPAGDGGEYSALVSVAPTPEPSSILGLLALGTLGAVIKRQRSNKLQA